MNISTSWAGFIQAREPSWSSRSPSKQASKHCRKRRSTDDASHSLYLVLSWSTIAPCTPALCPSVAYSSVTWWNSSTGVVHDSCCVTPK